MNTGETDGYTIDEVAAATRLTPRNIRAYQSRGLLPLPQRRGRRAVYGDAHVQRLRRIVELQGRGYNLAAVGVLLEAETSTGGAGQAEPLRRLTFAPLLEDASQVVPVEELAPMYSVAPNPAARQRAIELGLLRPLDGGLVELPSRTLADLVLALIAEGIPGEEMTPLLEAVILGTRPVARQFVQLLLSHAWQPFAAEGYPANRWAEVRERFIRLHRTAADVVLAAFALQLRQVTEELLDKDSVVRPQTS